MNKKVIIVIPCFNEAERLPISIFDDFIKKNSNITFLFVNDGSRDTTLTVLNKLQATYPLSVLVYDMPTNSGKAEAVRIGVNYALEFKPDFVGFFDADLATPLTEIDYFLKIFEEKQFIDIVCGCRIKRLGASLHRSVYRHIFGRIFATVSYLAIPLPMYDTQCGAKIMKPSVVHDAFQEPFITSWLFDMEIFARMIQKRGYQTSITQIYELPLNEWKEIKGSKLNFKSLLKVPIQLFRIFTHYKIRNLIK
jgi:glycosyltransferase involved in cell wall biosynthesis